MGGCSENRVSGEVAGARLEVRDAVFFTDSQDPRVPAQALHVVLTDTPRACERSKAGEPERNETALSFTLQRCDTAGNRHPVGAGTYDGRDCFEHPHSTNTAALVWRHHDAQGKETAYWEASSDVPASVELTAFQAVPGGRARGSFRAVLEGGFKVEGDFHATFCDQRLGPSRRRPAPAAPSATTSPPPPETPRQGTSGPTGPGPKPPSKT